jgi:phosphate:Na+ symporter
MFCNRENWGIVFLDDIVIATAILTLLAGIGVFLTACVLLSSNLESLSSGKLKKMFTKASKSKLYGVGIGTVGTAAIQSSGAMTVMVIGFVNAGIMTLPLAATIIYGANIGTTITAQLAAFGMFSNDSISLALIFAALAGVGGLMLSFAKKESTKIWAGVITGFGLLFVGLTMMASSMAEFAELPEVVDFLSSIDNIAILLIIGILLTALVQSSSVVTTLAITMVVAGLINLEQGIYLTLGSNIGSCVVALLAGFSGGLNAKRTAVIHLLFNVFGVAIFVVFGAILGLFDYGYAQIFETLFPDVPSTQLAMFHTVFNILTVVIMLPLTNSLVRLVMRIVPERESDRKKEAGEFKPSLHYLNDYMLRTPPMAIQQVMNEVVNMSKMAMENYRSACHMIRTMDFEGMNKFCNNE